eukprot:TRINITY_DN19243_c0_g1_i1.p1 TRINITY_DN19243_c0_g1~~TRINITY_DN19243_c0_g1_i1.p1  ORF type:complete len:213 (-),score=46.76 TRINITY_DN19243_c0_g1_i1:591-1229(-)
MSGRRGPPKHQNKYAWKADAGRKKNETEPGGKLRPLAEISGVCSRCKDQIEWKRKYGKYKLLKEPAKCNQCGKRAVRQAYHRLCSACAKERGVCAKCAHVVDNIVGRDADKVEAERKELEEAIRHARERDRRTLLRAMNSKKSSNSTLASAAGDFESSTKNHSNCSEDDSNRKKNHSDHSEDDFSSEGTSEHEDHNFESNKDADGYLKHLKI